MPESFRQPAERDIGPGQGQPRVDAAVLRSIVGAGEDDLVLWREDGECHVIESLDFCRVERANVRTARRLLTHG